MPADAAPAAGSQANAVGILQPSESAGPGILGRRAGHRSSGRSRGSDAGRGSDRSRGGRPQTLSVEAQMSQCNKL